MSAPTQLVEIQLVTINQFWLGKNTMQPEQEIYFAVPMKGVISGRPKDTFFVGVIIPQGKYTNRRKLKTVTFDYKRKEKNGRFYLTKRISEKKALGVIAA